MKKDILFLLFIVFMAPTIADARCFDLSNGEPNHLEGVLSARVFAGPPNYEDVQKGDAPEPGYVLKLDQPVCLMGDDDFADPTVEFDEVQLVPTDATWGAMRAMPGTRVAVTVGDRVPAHTGHHHRPLVAWVTSIFSISDVRLNGGSAASTVAGFYGALSLGDGDLAASFVIPEKTAKGPFSPEELTRFYGNLREPLMLTGVDMVTATELVVSYHFEGSGGTCIGRAQVFTETRNGRNFIRRIKALNGC
jgi:hypothetical protein